jgi:hypothetical protein
MPETQDEVAVDEPTKAKSQQKQGDGSVPSLDPDAALKAAQAQLAKAQFDVAEKAKKDKLDAELPKLREAYEKDQEAVQKNEDVLTNYSGMKRTALEEALTPQGVAKVNNAISKVQTDISNLEAEAKTKAGKLDDAKKDLDAAIADRDAAKSRFENLKKGAAAIKERQRSVEAARAEIEKADSAGNYALAYALLTGPYQDALKSEPHPVPASAYETAVQNAWAELTKAESDVRDKELAVKNATEDATAAKTALEAAQKNHDANLRAELEKIVLPKGSTSPTTSAEEG